jgi:GrpB-like predicted nucleotidyltransferase (UPF0157 family)
MSDSPLILPYLKKPAVCEDWDPCAPDVARRVAWLIERWLPDVQVEHIGSTSIPGCAGKGVIDLQVVYPPGRLEIVKDVMARLGFQPQQSRDPFPEDRPMRVGSIEYGGKRYNIHAHVLAGDALEIGIDRAFRDRLCADPDAMQAYVALKRVVLESGVTDTLDYWAGKREFIEDLVREIEAEHERR